VTHVFAIPSGAQNPEGAMAVLEWMASDEAAAIWARNGNISMITGAVEENSPEVVQELWATVGEASGALPWIENELPPGVGEDKVYSGSVALLTGEMTPEQFAQSIQEAMEASGS
jgi:ABC-type glycerol-3-phosphate transport system substrate-binding protein